MALGILAPQQLHAHQQPNTIVLLDVSPDKVGMELQIPLSELELAFGNDVTKNTDSLIERLSPQLKDYLKAHIRPMTESQAWLVEVTQMKVEEAEQTQSGAYQEIKVYLNLFPPPGVSTRRFTLNYNVIMHQVVSHRALTSIRNDWESGKTGEQPTEAGVIMVDTKTTQIFPLEINLEKGSWLEGFKGMVSLGMQHIKEGTDHLLFLLVLLLPATLLVNGKNWGDFGGTKYGIARLLKIVTAFTVGHSVTLLIGALGWLRMPQQPVEVLIAVSILISAVHAVRPIFQGKEMYVAAGFGLVHGLAFAAVLSDLNLGAGEMALSILGFNIGIELMQIFVIAVTVPWLILISLTAFYKPLRITGAALAAIAAVAWLAERISGNPNAVGGFVEIISQYAPAGILILALIALAAFGFQHVKNKKIPLETIQ
ncbi:MAG: HupE/UreJ family protein [Pyrinomonadaceae bacterium]